MGNELIIPHQLSIPMEARGYIFNGNRRYSYTHTDDTGNADFELPDENKSSRLIGSLASSGGLSLDVRLEGGVDDEVDGGIDPQLAAKAHSGAVEVFQLQAAPRQ